VVAVPGRARPLRAPLAHVQRLGAPLRCRRAEEALLEAALRGDGWRREFRELVHKALAKAHGGAPGAATAACLSMVALFPASQQPPPPPLPVGMAVGGRHPRDCYGDGPDDVVRVRPRDGFVVAAPAPLLRGRGAADPSHAAADHAAITCTSGGGGGGGGGDGGFVLLAADYCQIELRVMAHFSQDPGMLAAFQDPARDVFKSLAAHWKRRAYEDVTPELRAQVKQVHYMQ